MSDQKGWLVWKTLGANVGNADFTEELLKKNDTCLEICFVSHTLLEETYDYWQNCFKQCHIICTVIMHYGCDYVSTQVVLWYVYIKFAAPIIPQDMRNIHGTCQELMENPRSSILQIYFQRYESYRHPNTSWASVFFISHVFFTYLSLEVDTYWKGWAHPSTAWAWVWSYPWQAFKKHLLAQRVGELEILLTDFFSVVCWWMLAEFVGLGDAESIMKKTRCWLNNLSSQRVGICSLFLIFSMPNLWWLRGWNWMPLKHIEPIGFMGFWSSMEIIKNCRAQKISTLVGNGRKVKVNR